MNIFELWEKGQTIINICPYQEQNSNSSSELQYKLAKYLNIQYFKVCVNIFLNYKTAMGGIMSFQKLYV